MNRRVFAGLLLLPCLSMGCEAAPAGAGWRFRFSDPGLGARAELVETEIRRGGCDGATVFSTRVSPSNAGAEAPELTTGRYGFRGRARDANCQWFAEGCAEAELPHRGAIEIVLDLSMFPLVDESCIPGEQANDPATEGDAAVRDRDGAIRDRDAGQGPTTDATVPGVDGGSLPSFDPGAPKCTSLDPSVVACFDFANRLEDVSSAGNDATASVTPAFEPALSGQALRVAGARVSIADQASLNVGTLSIEVWLRPDGLVNLANEPNDISLLIDKDQQYNVGFTAQGALRMQIYRALNNSETTTAQNAVLNVGQFSYVAFTYDGTRSTIYNDGQRIESENVNIDLFRGNGGTLHIGSGSPDTTRPFDGLVDALRISNVARSQAEICQSAGKVLRGSTCK